GLYQREAARIRGALGDRALLIEHVGSTAVPGLAAKPRIDIVLAVTDSSSESDYVPALEAVGYVLRIREPGWFEHRLLGGPTPSSISTSSRAGVKRSTASYAFVTACGAAKPTAFSTRARSER